MVWPPADDKYENAKRGPVARQAQRPVRHANDAIVMSDDSVNESSFGGAANYHSGVLEGSRELVPRLGGDAALQHAEAPHAQPTMW
jgi:hypothetical protein